MKIFRYLALAIIPMTFIACDNFDEDEYMTLQGEDVQESTPITVTQSSQAILLEDYTGWKCTNCPEAAAILNDLQTKYGNQLVAMSVHAGSFARPSSINNNLDLRTEYGERWNTQFGLTQYPIGVINRVNNGTTKGFQKDAWDSEITSLLSSVTHRMNINLGAKVKDSYILVSANYNALRNIDFQTLTNVVVVENGIVGVQFNNNEQYGAVPEIDDYVFNHVLRTNGQVDTPLANNFSAGESVNQNYKITIDPNWVIDNCIIIVFVTNAVTGEVIQTNEIEL